MVQIWAKANAYPAADRQILRVFSCRIVLRHPTLDLCQAVTISGGLLRSSPPLTPSGARSQLSRQPDSSPGRPALLIRRRSAIALFCFSRRQQETSLGQSAPATPH